jgi:adenylate cyclase
MNKDRYGGGMEQTKRQNTILVVDKHQPSQHALKRILESANFNVVLADSAGQAMAVTPVPDAILVDIETPEMGGLDFCQELRSDPRYRFVSLIVMTSKDQGAVLRRAFAAGCDDVLDKPLQPLVVIARLIGQLRKYEVFAELDQVRRNLARYISPRLRRLVEQSSEAGEALPPQEREVCILFSDIRGFTALSQAISPVLLFSTISQQLGSQVDVVYRHRGYVDKFGGDGIMAVFDGPNMAQDACRCALEIMRQTESVQLDDGPPMPVGIGIHMGRVVEGNIGSGEHLDFSVIGNTVNLAARLCGHAQSRDIIVSEIVRKAVGVEPEMRFIEPQKVQIRGLRKPIELYRLVTAAGCAP